MTTPKKVMIVDESRYSLRDRKCAKKYGYRAVCSTDPLEAIKEFRNNNHEYAIVVSDIKMSGMDGFESARNVKEARHDMPLVLMTAFEIEDSEFLSLAACCGRAVQKAIFKCAADQHRQKIHRH